MKITCSGIVDGYYGDRFGKRGTQLTETGKCTYSVPFSITDAPEGTKSFAVVLDDLDAIPVCGFCWIHWTLCNLTETEVPENASVNSPSFIQGCTSEHGAVGGETREQASCYGGMAPPNCDHQYDLKVYALDCMLDLEPGFFLNELMHAMEGHVLAEAKTSGIYRA